MEGVNTYNVSSQLTDSVPRNVNFNFGSHVILVNDSISIQYPWSINIKNNNAQSKRSHQAHSSWVGEGEVDFFSLNVSILKFYPNILFISRFQIKALDEGFNFEANTFKVFFKGVCDFENLSSCILTFCVCKRGSPKFHISSSCRNEIDPKTFPLTFLSGLYSKVYSVFLHFCVFNFNFQQRRFGTHEFIDA